MTYNPDSLKKHLVSALITITTLLSNTLAMESPLSEIQIKSRLPENCLIFTGSANPDLGKKIAKELHTNLSPLKTARFADREINLRFETLVRDKNIFIIQPTCNTENGSPNDHLMELLLTIKGAQRASAENITAVIPYFGYARQDRKTSSGVPISASDVAEMIENTGVRRVLCVDLHCGQIQGFFHKTPVDNLDGSLIFASHIAKLNLDNVVIVSPDAGGMERARKFAEFLRVSGVVVDDISMIYKMRNKDNVIEITKLLGSVEGKNAIIVDDMVDSGGTLVKAGEELLNNGALNVYACITHGVFSGEALDKIKNSPFKKVMVTDTIPLRGEAPENLEVISAAPLIADAIERIVTGERVSDLFKTDTK